MPRWVLWGLAALCNFASAALTYNDGGRLTVVAMQVVASVLMVAAAFKFGRRG
jgi:hypothetical protein